LSDSPIGDWVTGHSPVDVDAPAAQPHAYFLAKELRAWATLPGGAIVPLIYIKDWNFHWQDAARLERYRKQ
jgi:hypothetical protein